MKSVAAGSITGVFLVLIFLCTILLIRWAVEFYCFYKAILLRFSQMFSCFICLFIPCSRRKRSIKQLNSKVQVRKRSSGVPTWVKLHVPFFHTPNKLSLPLFSPLSICVFPSYDLVLNVSVNTLVLLSPSRKCHICTEQYASLQFGTAHMGTVHSLQTCVSTSNCTITWWAG